jgi:Ca-activated chloride channel family protein
VRRHPGRQLLLHISRTGCIGPAGLLLLCLMAGPPSRFLSNSQAQNRANDQRSSIRVDVNLVSVIASVLDQNNRPAPDLQRDQFEIYEESQPQKIEVFEPETRQPLDLALMIDCSLSEIKELQFETEAAARFIGQVVRPEDRVGIFEFADTVTQLASFSGNVAQLQAAVRRVIPGDGTALYDAVYLGSDALAKAPPDRRKVLILITDAGETTSRADFETARRAALRAEALLYTIVIRPVKSENGRNTAGEHALETIADSTGGAMYYPDEASQLDAIFDRINRELRTQYLLGYYPQPRPPQGTYRSIEVRVKGNYKVRYRKSYYSGGLTN